MLRVLLTGGGSGGHVYPLLAVADKIRELGGADVMVSYLGPKSRYDAEFGQRDIAVYGLASSKLRRYMDVGNILDVPKFIFGLCQALYRLYLLMPDVVFSKGGSGALPVVLAAKFYFIPILIHESDSVPGLTNRFSAPFAKRIGVSFEEIGRASCRERV
jgi:UDP-N-acetylglucosamine--N-acetylmuramyl-(pentapeptide) pyrophosphoryl-undecaprenol N-acetylglucosamine transferase